MNDPILAERAHDLDDLRGASLRHLVGRNRPPRQDLPTIRSWVARGMGPGRVARLSPRPPGRSGAGGGGFDSHVAIVARAMGLPVVKRLQGITDAARRADLIVWRAKPRSPPAPWRRDHPRVHRQADLTRAPGGPVRHHSRSSAETKDGIRIKLMMNAGLLLDMPHLAESGADGIGLFPHRNSVHDRRKYAEIVPSAEFYREVLDTAGDKSVVFRTLDLGATRSCLTPLGTRGKPGHGLARHPHRSRSPALLRYQVRARLWRRRAGAAHSPADDQLGGGVQCCPLWWEPRSRAGAAAWPAPTPPGPGRAMLEVPSLALCCHS